MNNVTLSLFRTYSSIPIVILAPLLIVLSEAFLVFSGVFVKLLAEDMHSMQIVFGRNLFGLMLMLPWALTAGIGAFRTSLIKIHLLRAGVGVTAMSCMFYGWANLPLAQAALIKQTAPFFVPFIAFFWLGESLSKASKWAILIGFAGVALVLNPTEGALNLAVFVALFGAALGALAKVTVRRMHTTEPAKRIVFYFALFSSMLTLLPVLYVWQPLTLVSAGLLVAVAATSTIAQLLLSKAYGLQNAGYLAPFTYSSVVIAAMLGWFIWAESLGWVQWLGVLVITLAGWAAAQKKLPSFTFRKQG